jgi:hypothetical protein
MRSQGLNLIIGPYLKHDHMLLGVNAKDYSKDMKDKKMVDLSLKNGRGMSHKEHISSAVLDSEALLACTVYTQ